MKIKIFALLSITVFTACKNNSTDEVLKAGDMVPVELAPIGLQKGVTDIEASGIFSTDNEILLSFKNGGVIERIYVKEGDPVKKGEILATVNMTEINARAAQAKSALEKADRDYSRARQLFKDSVATKEQMENAKTALDVVRQDWNSIQFNLQYSEIRATTDGYILRKLANEGQIVGPGIPVLQMNGTGKGNWVVKAGVSDRQWATIQKGDRATIAADVFSGDISGRVIRKSEGLDPQSGTFTVYVQPNLSKGLPIAAGVFAKVKIYGQSAESWLIPYSALLDGDGGKGYVFVTDDGLTANKIEVRLGTVEKDNITLLGGLEGHKYLIISGSPYLKDGSKIKVVKK